MRKKRKKERSKRRQKSYKGQREVGLQKLEIKISRKRN